MCFERVNNVHLNGILIENIFLSKKKHPVKRGEYKFLPISLQKVILFFEKRLRMGREKFEGFFYQQVFL